MNPPRPRLQLPAAGRPISPISERRAYRRDAVTIVQLLAALMILVPAPPNKPEGWTGQVVMQKITGVSYRYLKPEPNDGAGSLRMIEYRVLADRGDDLVLVEDGREIVVAKESMVLQTE